MLHRQQVRDFAPIGILEFWNIGIMGSGLRLGEDNAMLDQWSRDRWTTIALFLPRVTFYYFTEAISGANSEAPKTPYILSRL